MKKLPGKCKFHIWKLILLLLFLASSCTYILFDTPQPVDSKNLSKIPRELRGLWVHTDSQNPVLKDTIRIDENSFLNIVYTGYKVPMRLIDSSSYFKIIGDKLFVKDENPAGYRYRVMNDTLFYANREQVVFRLSDSILLRPAKGGYVFCRKIKGWWELSLIRKEDNGDISIYYPDEDEMTARIPASVMTALGSDKNGKQELSDDTLYYHASFTSKSVLSWLSYNPEKALYILHPDFTFDCEICGFNK